MPTIQLASGQQSKQADKLPGHSLSRYDEMYWFIIIIISKFTFLHVNEHLQILCKYVSLLHSFWGMHK